MAVKAGRDANKAQALLSYLVSLGKAYPTTTRSLARTLFERAALWDRDLFHVADETLMRYTREWIDTASLGMGIGDASHGDEWTKAAEALTNYIAKYPELRVGQAISNLTDRYWLSDYPSNRDLLALIRWDLEGVNPHLGCPVVVQDPHDGWLLVTLDRQHLMDGLPFYTFQADRRNTIYREVEADHRTIIGGGQMLIITTDRPEGAFRRLLASHLTTWFLEHDPDDYSWCSEPDDFIKWLNELGRNWFVPKPLRSLVRDVITEAANGDDLLAAYFTYRLTGVWPPA